MSVTTHRRTTLVVLTAERVRALIAQDAGYLLGFAGLVSAHARVLTEQLDIAATRDADVRVARKIAARVGAHTGAQLAATQWELAEMTNSSRNTVNRSLGALERAGALKSGYGQIVVTDGARLARIAGYGTPKSGAAPDRPECTAGEPKASEAEAIGR
ncbi:MAG: Crp/Fnr family transcriptional regulator [Alphaproteobacteria bacterium]